MSILRIIRFTLLGIIGLWLDYIIMTDADSQFFLDGILMFILSAAFLIIFYWAVSSERNEFKKTKSRKAFIGTAVGLLFIISFCMLNYALYSRDRSPVLIQAGYDGGYNGAWFEFREDMTYKFGNSSGLGVDYFRGKYKINDSIITLDKSPIDSTVKSAMLAFRAIHRSDSMYKRGLYQIDANHKVIDSELVFVVHEDKRRQ